MFKDITFIESVSVKSIKNYGQPFIQVSPPVEIPLVSHANADINSSATVDVIDCPVHHFCHSDLATSDTYIAYSPDVQKYIEMPLEALKDELHGVYARLKRTELDLVSAKSLANEKVQQLSAYKKAVREMPFTCRLKFLIFGAKRK